MSIRDTSRRNLLTAGVAVTTVAAGAGTVVLAGVELRPDDHIRALVTEMETARDAGNAVVETFRSSISTRMRLHDGDVRPTWQQWQASTDGAEYERHGDVFAAACLRLLDARPTTLAGYALKLEALHMADLDDDDQEKLAAERQEFITQAVRS